MGISHIERVQNRVMLIHEVYPHCSVGKIIALQKVVIEKLRNFLPFWINNIWVDSLNHKFVFILPLDIGIWY